MVIYQFYFVAICMIGRIGLWASYLFRFWASFYQENYAGVYGHVENDDKGVADK